MSFSEVLQRLERINLHLVRMCNILATLLCAMIALGVFAGVVARLLQAPLDWSEELPKYCMVWMTFLGAPVALHKGAHVALDAWHGRVPAWLNHGLRLGVALLCSLILCLFIGYGIKSTWLARGQSIILMGELSMAWIYLAVPLGSSLMLYGYLVQALRQVYLMLNNKDCSPEQIATD